MKLNIFQKIAFLVFISVIVLICVYFAPYQNNDNYTFHSSIMSDGYGAMSYFRFLIYLIVPTLSFCFVYKYLEAMNTLESNVYKKKGKQELYIFFVFVSIIVGTILFSYGKNEYFEIRKITLKKEIASVEVELNKTEEELQRPSLSDKDTLDEYGIPIKKPWERNYEVENSNEEKKPLFNPNKSHKTAKKQRLTSIEKENDAKFVSKEILLTDKENKLLVSELTNYVKESATDNELQEFKYFFAKVLINKKWKVKKENLESKLKEISFNKDKIKNSIVFMFLASFILLYIIRPLFSMFKGMLREVR